MPALVQYIQKELSPSDKKNIEEKIIAYQLEVLRSINILKENEINEIIYIPFGEGKTGFYPIYNSYFKGKEWEWSELEKWRDFGFKTNKWIGCLYQKILRHNFSKDNISDLFECISIQEIRKNILAIDAFYPTKNIKKTILNEANNNSEYKNLLIEIMREHYRFKAYNIMWRILSDRADNTWQKIHAEKNGHKYYWEILIENRLDEEISKEIKKNVLMQFFLLSHALIIIGNLEY